MIHDPGVSPPAPNIFLVRGKKEKQQQQDRVVKLQIPIFEKSIVTFLLQCAFRNS